MNFSPIDILIIVFVLAISSTTYNDGFIKSISKTINLIASIILSNLIISNLSLQIPYLKKAYDIFYLSTYFLIFIIIMLLLGFIFELIIEQLESFNISKSLDILAGITTGVIKGFILITILIFIFDTIPSMSNESRNAMYNKFESKSILFKPCSNLKEILFNSY